MTIKEAIENLEKLFSDSTDEEYWQTEEFAEAVGIAIEALEKQIPKKYKTDIYKDKICPICESILQGRKRYCHWCGQKVDWE